VFCVGALVICLLLFISVLCNYIYTKTLSRAFILKERTQNTYKIVGGDPFSVFDSYSILVSSIPAFFVASRTFSSTILLQQPFKILNSKKICSLSPTQHTLLSKRVDNNMKKPYDKKRKCTNSSTRNVSGGSGSSISDGRSASGSDCNTKTQTESTSPFNNATDTSLIDRTTNSPHRQQQQQQQQQQLVAAAAMQCNHRTASSEDGDSTSNQLRTRFRAGSADDVPDDDNDDDDTHNATMDLSSTDNGSITVACDYIAELCESILEDPNQAFSAASESNHPTDSSTSKPQRSKGRRQQQQQQKPQRGWAALSKMDQLLFLARRALPKSTTSSVGENEDAIDRDGTFRPKNPHPQQYYYVAQLAIMSLLAIYKDILPDYRIRIPTEHEMAMKVSKNVQQLWDYERKLLHHYQQYLMVLEKTWELHQPFPPHPPNSSTTNQDSPVTTHNNVDRNGLAISAILSLAELLKSAFHFNFRSNLLTAVVRQMNHKSSAAIRKACCDAVEYIFIQDHQGEVTLEATRQVAKLIKDRDYKVHPDVVRTFHCIPLRVHADEAVAAKLASHVQAKKRKVDRELATIAAEIKEGHTTVDKIILARCQSDTLQSVILTYFRILKSDHFTVTYVQELLPTALEGLAKFAHLINIDTVIDLLSVLRDLLKKVDTLPVDAALNCILTAFQTLQGPGKEMKIDQKEYIMPLYSQLPRICTVEGSEKHTDLLLQCLTAAFIQRREYSNVRIAAFLKQILSTALHTPPHTSIPLLAFARQIIQRYKNVEQMLENEFDVITEGQYMPDVEDPEHANPYATSVWELATLKFHWRTDVAAQAVAAASSKMLNLPSEHPDKLRSIAIQNTKDLFIPFVRVQKRHPLYAKPSSSDKQKNRNQIRFVTPRPSIIH
jgi:nucleolar complex protein 3